MQLPILSLNGTKKESLVEDLCDAAHAVRTAIEVLARCHPNGRDYIDDDNAFLAARREHMIRRDRLGDTLEELEALAEQITDLGV